MKHRSLVRIGLSSLLAAVSLVGCWENDPCDPGQVFRSNACFPGAAAGSGDAGGNAATEAGSPDAMAGATGTTESTWQQPCKSDADCAGDSPLCATSPLNYCTNINCSPGEANAGICPAGWTCFPASSGNPSACVKF